MTFRAWQTLMVGFVCAILAAGSSMAYTNRAAKQSNQQWCDVIITLDDAYRAVPNKTPTIQRLAQQFAQLRTRFACPDGSSVEPAPPVPTATR